MRSELPGPGSTSRIRLGEATEVCEAVEGQVIGVVDVVVTALGIVKGGAAGGNDVLPVELPVHIMVIAQRRGRTGAAALRVQGRKP